MLPVEFFLPPLGHLDDEVPYEMPIQSVKRIRIWGGHFLNMMMVTMSSITEVSMFVTSSSKFDQKESTDDILFLPMTFPYARMRKIQSCPEPLIWSQQDAVQALGEN